MVTQCTYTSLHNTSKYAKYHYPKCMGSLRRTYSTYKTVFSSTVTVQVTGYYLPWGGGGVILHISADSHVQPTLSPYSYPVHMRLSVRNNPVNRVEFLWPISEKVLKTNEIVRLHCTSLTIVNLLSLLIF